MNLVCKKASTSDINTLIDLETNINNSKLYYSERSTLEELLDEINNGVVYIVEKDREVAGEIMYENKSSEHVFISWIFIHPKFQGQGIAKQAMSYVLGEIGEVKRIDLVTHPENTKAISLYKSLGFTIESTKENYFGDGEPRVVMSLVKEIM